MLCQIHARMNKNSVAQSTHNV